MRVIGFVRATTLRLERFSQSRRALASRHSVFHQVKPFRRGHMIDQTGLVPIVVVCVFLGHATPRIRTARRAVRHQIDVLSGAPGACHLCDICFELFDNLIFLI